MMHADRMSVLASTHCYLHRPFVPNMCSVCVAERSKSFPSRERTCFNVAVCMHHWKRKNVLVGSMWHPTHAVCIEYMRLRWFASGHTVKRSRFFEIRISNTLRSCMHTCVHTCYNRLTMALFLQWCDTTVYSSPLVFCLSDSPSSKQRTDRPTETSCAGAPTCSGLFFFHRRWRLALACRVCLWCSMPRVSNVLVDVSFGTNTQHSRVHGICIEGSTTNEWKSIWIFYFWLEDTCQTGSLPNFSFDLAHREASQICKPPAFLQSPISRVPLIPSAIPPFCQATCNSFRHSKVRMSQFASVGSL